MKYTIKGKLAVVTRLNNSVNGNPKYECEVVPFESCHPMTLNCGRLRGKTASDTMYAYNLPSPGNWVQVTYHTTRTGRVIFDNIQAL